MVCTATCVPRVNLLRVIYTPHVPRVCQVSLSESMYSPSFARGDWLAHTPVQKSHSTFLPPPILRVLSPLYFAPILVTFEYSYLKGILRLCVSIHAHMSSLL